MSRQAELIDVTENLPLGLSQTGVDGDTGEVLLAKKLIQLDGAVNALHENDDLVELQAVKQLAENAVLVLLLDVGVELLQTVKSELGLIVDVDFQGVLHELFAGLLDLRRERGAEHHDLLLGRSGTEDLLDIVSHVYTANRLAACCDSKSQRLSEALTKIVEHLVTLVKDKSLNRIEVEHLVTNKGV